MLSFSLVAVTLANFATCSFGFSSTLQRPLKSLPVKSRRRGLNHSLLYATSANASTSSTACSTVSFSSPLLQQGYPPAVNAYRAKTLRDKPLLIYLPGFDGTLVAPFMQFPELGTEFDVRGMSVDMKDRSSLNDLVNMVLNYIDESIQSDEGENRHIYLVGESFGGILALEVATAIKERNLRNVSSGLSINLQGVTLINPATCYNQSKLARDAPPLTQIPSFLYPFALLRLIPLFTDNYALPQLLLILQSKALPSVIDTPQREAYMGRTALSLPFALKFMPQETLKWRLTEWLTKGCTSIQEKEGDVKRLLGDLPVLIVAGEEDQTLPSVMEANRISSALFKRSKVHIVPGAGHACTSGSRVDLTALMREWFPLEYEIDGRLQMKDIAVEGSDLYFGMEPRYDKANIGLSPLLYWSEDYYKKI